MATTQHFSDATRDMIRSVRNRYPHLTKEREDALIEAWRSKGDTHARDCLVLGHMDLMIGMVNRLLGYGLPADELLSQAVQGMQRAIPGYDLTRGLRFGTFASAWIQESMMTYIMANVRPVRGPHTASAKAMFFHRSRLRQELGIQGSLSEDDAVRIRERLMEKLPSAEKFTLKSIMDSDEYMSNSFVSTDVPVSKADGEEGRMILDTIADDAEAADDALGASEEEGLRAAILHKAMLALNERQLDVFRSRRLAEPALTLEDLSIKYGVSRERIRQIEVKALEIVSAKSINLLKEYERAGREKAALREQEALPAPARPRVKALEGVRNPFSAPPVNVSKSKLSTRAKPYARMQLSEEEVHRRRSMTTKRANMSRTPEQRSMITLKGNMSRTPEQRRLISLKSAETLRLRRAAQAAQAATLQPLRSGRGPRAS